MADRHNRRLVAAAHARRAHDPDIVAEPALEIAEQLRRAGEFAAEAVADPHRHRRRRRLVVHDDVEMGVERGDLVDLDERQPHLLGQRRQMAGMQAAEMVLQQMQMLDQQVAATLALAEQRLHLGRGCRIDLPALRVVGPRRRPDPGWMRRSCLGRLHLRASNPLSALSGRGRRPRPRARVRWASALYARFAPTLPPTCAGNAGIGSDGWRWSWPSTPPSPRAAPRSRPRRSRASRGSRRCARRATANASPRPASRKD